MDIVSPPVALSIVTPVYNAAPWLPDFLQSLRGQTLQNWQLICVDDGSTDDSLALLRDAAAGDGRLLVLHQENAGPSAARNAALERVSGRYVTFVDADDTLEPDYLQTLLEAAVATGADVVVSGWTYVASQRQEAHSVTEEPVLTEEATPAVLEELPKHACARLYARRVLEQSGARFPEGLRYGEDTVFHYGVYPYCHKVARVAHKGYLYRASAGSLSAHSRQSVVHMVEGAEYLEHFYRERLMLEAQRENLLRYVVHALRRIRSMAPASCQRQAGQRLRGVVQRAGAQEEELNRLRRKDARVLRRLLAGGVGPGLGWYAKRLSRWLRGK